MECTTLVSHSKRMGAMTNFNSCIAAFARHCKPFLLTLGAQNLCLGEEFLQMTDDYFHL